METIFDFCQHLPQKTFQPGEFILKEGEQSNTLFILIDGEIEIMKQNMQIALVKEPGSILGEISILLDSMHIAEAKATQTSTLYIVENGNTFLNQNPKLLFYLSEMLAYRLSNVTSFLVTLQEKHESRIKEITQTNNMIQELVEQHSSVRELLKRSFTVPDFSQKRKSE